MATTFFKINPKLKYVIFDTPEINVLQYYYIKKIIWMSESVMRIEIKKLY